MRFRHNLMKKNIKQLHVRLAVLTAALVLAVVAVMQPFAKPEIARADTYDDQIKALQSQIDSYNSKASDLAAQADTLNNKIAELQNQQSQLQSQIDLTTAKSNELKSQIAVNEAKIKEQSTALAQTLSNMYYSQQTSTLDILMNSKSVSDYVDKTTQQDSLQQQISASVGQITAIKKQLEQQKAQVDQLLATQQAQQQALADTQAQQQNLLDQTQGQEANYQKLVSDNQAQIVKVQAAQQAYIASLQAKYHGQTVSSSQCGGGYPFCTVAPDTYAVDPVTGFHTSGNNARECVNYVQWRIYELTGRFEIHGNANAWPVTSSTPKVNSVGVMRGGTYGHVVWVEQVGTGEHAGEVYVSQYNWVPYAYSTMWYPSAAFAGFYYVN